MDRPSLARTFIAASRRMVCDAARVGGTPAAAENDARSQVPSGRTYRREASVDPMIC